MNCLNCFRESADHYCSEACRFWAKVLVVAPSSCWWWQGSRTPDGYGTFKPSAGSHISEGKAVQYAHRAAHIIAKGAIPDGLHVLHSCDNPSCCNPAHLRVGTPSENMRDMHSRGRHVLRNPLRGDANPARAQRDKMPRGEASGRAKLTWPSVRAIRAARALGESAAALAVRFGVAEKTIRDVVTWKTWIEREN